jgi:hypothetical protein
MPSSYASTDAPSQLYGSLRALRSPARTASPADRRSRSLELPHELAAGRGSAHARQASAPHALPVTPTPSPTPGAPSPTPSAPKRRGSFLKRALSSLRHSAFSPGHSALATASAPGTGTGTIPEPAPASRRRSAGGRTSMRRPDTADSSVATYAPSRSRGPI